MPREPCVYILASRPHGAIYTGLTSDLPRRVWQHKRGQGSAFTRRYQIDKLVWMEPRETMDQAILGRSRSSAGARRIGAG